MFICNFYDRPKEKMLAVCDESLLGQTLNEGEIVFDVDSDFYGNTKTESDKIIELAEKSSIINAIGNDIVQLLVDNDFIDEERILYIEGIAHAQMVKI